MIEMGGEWFAEYEKVMYAKQKRRRTSDGLRSRASQNII